MQLVPAHHASERREYSERKQVPPRHFWGYNLLLRFSVPVESTSQLVLACTNQSYLVHQFVRQGRRLANDVPQTQIQMLKSI
jgi:hypothetical protein